MILALSRFRVVNGLEAQVRAAFAQRPRLVDDVPGFLGIETFTNAKDPSVFVLSTRWTDEASFRSWHSSAAHNLSHAGIPPGLKLDPAFTEITILDRLPDPVGSASLEVLVADAPALVASFLAQTRATHLFAGALDGTLSRVNEVAAEKLGAPAIGEPIWHFLVEPDQATLRACVASGRRNHRGLRLNFVGPSREPYTLDCVLEVGGGFTLLGEAPGRHGGAIEPELAGILAELHVLARENVRTRRELAKALTDLKESHWHVKKLQAVLPMCLDCGLVCSEGRWESPRTFLRDHTTFLSHGYCPECGERAKARFAAGDG